MGDLSCSKDHNGKTLCYINHPLRGPRAASQEAFNILHYGPTGSALRGEE